MAPTATWSIDIWTIALQAAPALRDLDTSALDAQESRRLDAYIVPDAASRFAVTRLALRRLLAARGGVAPAEVSIVPGLHGKPRSETVPGVFFNVSHAGTCAVVAICARFELGIDIEEIGHFDQSTRLWTTVCSDAERAMLARDASAADRELGRLWTRKESLLKALGTGLARPANSLDLSAQMAATSGLISPREDAFGDLRHAWWRELQISSAHLCSVAARAEEGAGPAAIHVRAFDVAVLRR